MTARSAGRAIVTSPTSAECQDPHSQALTSTPVKPSQAAVSSLWNDSRRISPSPTTGRPIILLHGDDLAHRPVLGRLQPGRGQLAPRVGVAGVAQEFRAQQAPDMLDPRIDRHNAQRPTPGLPGNSRSPATGPGDRPGQSRKPDSRSVTVATAG